MKPVQPITKQQPNHIKSHQESPHITSTQPKHVNLTEKQVAQIQELYKTGSYAQHQIAKKLGISRQAVAKWCKRINTPANKQTKIELDRQALIKALERQQVTPETIAIEIKGLLDSGDMPDKRAAVQEYIKIMGFYKDKGTDKDRDNVTDERYHVALPINPRDEA